MSNIDICYNGIISYNKWDYLILNDNSTNMTQTAVVPATILLSFLRPRVVC